MEERGGISLLAGVLLLASVPTIAADEDLFKVLEIPSSGRTVAAEIAELNGDGRSDLLQFVVLGMPPNEQRFLRVFLQRADGFSLAPSFERPLPKDTAAYDVAEVLPSSPGVELVLLGPDGVDILSLSGREAVQSRIDVSGGTVGAGADERGMESLQLVWAGIGAGPVLLIPQLGRLTVAKPDGEIVSVLEVGGRANYFVPPRGSLWFVESDLQLFFDSPHISTGDVDGDGRADIVSSARHYVRVFLQKPNGGFATQPDRLLPLQRLTEQDHMRGSGGVSAQAHDVNGDGRLDLLVSHIHGGFSDTRTVSTLHLNRDGAWDLAKSDQTFDSRGSVGADVLVDLNSDGRAEMVQVAMPFSVLEFVEALLTRSIDARLSFHRTSHAGINDEPYADAKLSVPVSFETFRSKGFLPTVRGDLDGDGIMDLVTAGAGNRVEVFAGGSDKPYRRRAASQDMDSRSRAHLGDVNGDGLDDILIYDPQRPGAQLRLATNRGTLAKPKGSGE